MVFGSSQQKKLTVIILDRLHVLIFGKKMGVETRRFIKNIGYIGLGTTVSMAIFFAVQMVAIRALGPDEYGKINLVLSVGNFLPFLMFMGLQESLVKYLSESRDQPNTHRIIISTCICGIVFFAIVILLLIYSLRDYIIHFSGLTGAIFMAAFFFSIFNFLKILAESILKGLLKFKTQAMLEILYPAVIFIIFFALFFSGVTKTFMIYIYAFSAGLLAYTFVFIQYRQYIRPSFFDKEKFRTFLPYAFYSVLGSISLSLLWNSDRFFLNKFFDTKIVGIYAVYYGASLVILGRLTMIFMKVFFPTASGNKNKVELEQKLGRLMQIGFIPLFIFNSLVIYVILLIAGKDYPINIYWIILFSFNAIINTFINVKGTLLAAEGMRGLMFYSRYSFGMAILILALHLLLIPTFGIYGAITGVIVSSLLLFWWISSYSKRILTPDPYLIT